MRLAPEFLRLAGARSPLAPSLSRGRSLSPPQGRETGYGPIAGARPARFRALRAGARAPLRRWPRAPPPRSRPAPGSVGRERPPARKAARASRPPAPASRPARAWRTAARSGRVRGRRPTAPGGRSGTRGSRDKPGAPRATGVAARAAGAAGRAAPWRLGRRAAGWRHADLLAFATAPHRRPWPPPTSGGRLERQVALAPWFGAERATLSSRG